MIKVNDKVKTAQGMGTVTKIEGQLNDIIFVKIGNDTYKLYQGINPIEVVNTYEYQQHMFQQYLEKQSIEYSACGAMEEISYCINGYTYNVYITIDTDGIYCETMHKERERAYRASTKWQDEDKSAIGNERKVMHLSTALSYLEKYVNL